MRKVRSSLHDLYSDEYLYKLIVQATDKRNRYKPVKHKTLNVGDIVLVKETNCKPSHYPMAIVRKLQVNDLGETTGAVLFKGATRELIKKHSSTLILLLKNEITECNLSEMSDSLSSPLLSSKRLKRAAAVKSEKITRKILKAQ